MKDFNNWTVYKSPGKKLDHRAGAWDKSGLVLNDVERYGDYWYGSPLATDPFIYVRLRLRPQVSKT